MGGMIPCQWCRQEYVKSWPFLVCDGCGFRICQPCLGKHQGSYGAGFKCSQCAFGNLSGG